MIRKLLVLALFAGQAGCYALQFEEELVTTYCDRVTACEADILAFYTAAGYDQATAEAQYATVKDGYCNPEPSNTEDCDFNSDNAHQCVDEAKDQSCTDYAQGLTPSTCSTSSICGG